MKKSILFVLAAAALCSCNGNRYTIKGELAQKGTTDTVRLMSLTQTDAPEIASAPVDLEGNFTFKGEVTQPDITVLTDKRGQGLGILFLEPGQIEVTPAPLGQAQGLIQTSGTPSNDAFASIQEKMMVLQGQLFSSAQTEDMEKADSIEQAFKNLILTCIEENRDNQAGIYLFESTLPGLELDEAREIQSHFTPELQQHPMMASISQTLDAIENIQIGKPFTDITLRAATTDEPLAVSSLIESGKWVLIDFWATWCGPCRAEMPYLKAAYKKFADKGFTIYGVSLDSNQSDWLSFLEKEQITWPNVNVYENDEPDPIVEKYAIRSIPTNFLISPEGVIVARDLRGEELEVKLTELIK